MHDDARSVCVPDFSCCRPALLAPREVREVYLVLYLRQYDPSQRRAREARQRVRRMQIQFLWAKLAYERSRGKCFGSDC